MKPIFLLAAILFIEISATAQKTPLVTDRPVIVNPVTTSSEFLESIFEYYETEPERLPSGDDVKHFGYYSRFEHSKNNAGIKNDSIEIIIRLKPNTDFSKYNFSIHRLFFDKKLDRRNVLVGYKKGQNRIFAPYIVVKYHVQPLDENVYAVTVPAKRGDEFALFFGPLRDGVPANKMYCVGAVLSPKTIAVSSN
jgi:hypothetical protein